MEYPHNRPYTADDLVRIITLLRDPVNGCPWDKVQTHTSIRMNFLEEAYEAVDALDLDDPVLMCEELGDVLMQVAFHTCMEQETGRFTWEQVCDGVCQKLIERHPNIFGTQPGYEGITDWDALKNKEKGRRTLADDLESVPRAMPALMRAAKLQKTTEPDGTVQCAVLEPKLLPTVTHYDAGKSNVRTYLFRDYTQELAKQHGVRAKHSDFSLDTVQKIAQNNISASFLALT
mgnify:CR=1 FL=1